MNELNDEIKLTINTMQCDIDEGAHGELQSHLCSLLEMKRERLSELVYTYTPAQFRVWPDAADDRIDVIGQNGNDGEHYQEALIGKLAGGGIIIGFEGEDAITMCAADFGSMSWDDAVQFCETFSLDNHNNWRLPTKDQLNLAWVNREKLGDLDLDDYRYWSSTQSSAGLACVLSFTNGRHYEICKSSTIDRVRQVRSVKIEDLEFEGSYIVGDA